MDGDKVMKVCHSQVELYTAGVGIVSNICFCSFAKKRNQIKHGVFIEESFCVNQPNP